MLNVKQKLKLKVEMKLLIGTAAFLFLGSVANAQTQGTDSTLTIPQIVPNSNSQFTPNKIPDPWAFDALDKFAFEAHEASDQEGTVPLTGALVSWESAFTTLLKKTTSSDSELTLVYRIANRSLELAQSLNGVAQQEIDSGIPGYDATLDDAIGPMIDVYHHGADAIKSIKEIDGLYYVKALKRSKHIEEPNSPALADSLKKLEDGLRAYGIGEITWFRKTFLLEKRNPATGVVTWMGPNYSEEVYYTVLDNLLKGIIEDLTGEVDNRDPVLFPAVYANSVSQLKTLHKFIERYQNGNRTLANTNYTFIFVNNELNKVLESLKDGQ